MNKLNHAVLFAVFVASAAFGAEPAQPPAQTAPAPTANKPAAASAEPAVRTSTPARADRLELDTTIVTGNRELPKVLYIVPWKKADIGELPAQPARGIWRDSI